MSEHIVDVIALRHGLALGPSASNPSLDPNFVGKIDGAAFTIMDCQDDIGQVTLFTSPARRAIETGEILLQSRHLESSSHLRPTVSPYLAEGSFKDCPVAEKELKWMSVLHEMASMAVRQTAVGRRPGLVLVTHAPVILDLPPLKSRRASLNLDNLGINYFTLAVDEV